MITLCYVEDDPAIAHSVKEYLEQRDFLVTVWATIEEAKEAVKADPPQIVLLDRNMPDGQGSIFCRWLRARWERMPIIFLTVLGDSHDIVSGFSEGADDYVVKPFELEVLHSRILALLRRTVPVEGMKLTCGDIVIDKERVAVYQGQEEVALSQPEYQLLLLLMENKGKTVLRSQILEQVWDVNGSFVNDNTLTVTMKRLRTKLGSAAHIKTVRSFGYRMEDA